MNRPQYPKDLGIIDITLDDLYAYAAQMEEFHRLRKFVPLAYVSPFPVCPPAGYPAPMESLNRGVPLSQLPQPRGADGLFPDERSSATATG
ncbi:MAG: hypothetical protein Q7U38_12395 [Methylobacter sp.]|nr:hypothetical protein [Methylobacter sp.]MDP2098436.1 hypothetical protein [Methylobacter sp.]MDP2427479.1 hypothetical protein [Methylobacter sp.]MDP3055067.1 hypothetical protein [Methylobacter sp.]MDP3361444.1 hypothetical protein [Methylobacter sp.]